MKSGAGEGSAMTSQSLQSLPDIEIPDIEIDQGWSVSEIETLADCDDAFAFLMSACAAIEYSIDIEVLKPIVQQRGEWMARAKSALKYKKAALQIVNHKRGRLNKEEDIATQNQRDRVLLEYIRQRVSDEQFLEWVKGSGALRVLGSEKAA